MDLLTANDRPGAYPASWYAATATPLDPLPPATGEMRADVCIVGGGFSGLSAALHLAQAGIDVVLVEAQRLGFGASGRNGGQVGTGQRVDQDVLEGMVGKDKARALWDLSLDSVALVRSLVETHAIDCGWTPGIIEAAHRARFVPDYHAYAEKLARDYGHDGVRPLSRDEMRAKVGSPAYHGGLVDMVSGHLHPLRYALGLARAAQAAGARLHEGSKVTGVGDNVVRTDSATIRADHIILCCNGYLGALNGDVAARVMPINNFIAATEPLDDATARSLIRDREAVADSKFVINYFRLSDDNRMLFGGGESYGYRFPPRHRRYRAQADVPDLSAACRGPHRLCLGRHAGHHHEPDAAFRPARAQPAKHRRLFGSRRRYGHAGRQTGGTGRAGSGRGL